VLEAVWRADEDDAVDGLVAGVPPVQPREQLGLVLDRGRLSSRHLLLTRRRLPRSSDSRVGLSTTAADGWLQEVEDMAVRARVEQV
jgi:hypothetical protein